MKFSEAIKKAKEKYSIAIIPDIKFYSPVYGDLLRNRKPLDLANQIAFRIHANSGKKTEKLNYFFLLTK